MTVPILEPEESEILSGLLTIIEFHDEYMLRVQDIIDRLQAFLAVAPPQTNTGEPAVIPPRKFVRDLLPFFVYAGLANLVRGLSSMGAFEQDLQNRISQLDIRDTETPVEKAMFLFVAKAAEESGVFDGDVS